MIQHGILFLFNSSYASVYFSWLYLSTMRLKVPRHEIFELYFLIKQQCTVRVYGPLINRFTWDVVAQLGMWWLRWGCGGSVGDVVAKLGMWWLRWGCGGSVGDVVAQSGMWWLSWLRRLGEPDCNAAVPGSIPASSTVS
jgi:hypothetical protein